MDNKTFNVSRDLLFSILALILYNGVLQLIIYPELGARMGADAFGTVLYLISIVSIMGAGFGASANYSRLMAKKDRTQENGDYNIFLLMITGLSVIVSFVSLLVLKELSVSAYLSLFILMVISIFRYYADVEFRMTIRFKEYFIFFVILSAGYILGLFLYPATQNWALVLLIGEIAAIIYTAVRGTIFRPSFFKTSDNFKENLKSAWAISASNLIATLILNSDRVLLRLLVGAREVTIFYTASLIGKIIAMLTGPLNGVIISYFTNYKIKLTKKVFSLISLATLLLSFIASVPCTWVSGIFVKLMYPEVYEEAVQYLFPANLGQILYFLSGSLMVLVLSLTKEKIHLVINVLYVIIFILIVIPGTYLYGLSGMAIGLVIINLSRLLTTICLGFRYITAK